MAEEYDLELAIVYRVDNYIITRKVKSLIIIKEKVLIKKNRNKSFKKNNIQIKGSLLHYHIYKPKWKNGVLK